MPKYEIEIPDGVLPEGTVPVAYRKPRPEDHYLSSVNSQHVCHAPKGKFCEKEAFLIVEKRPEPKFKVGDKVIVGSATKTCATIHSVGSTARGPYYCLKYPSGNIGTLRWHENELKPYVPKPEPKFKVGDWVKLDLWGFHQVERVWWSDISDTWWYDLSDHWQSNGTGTRLATRVPLTQDDAVKLALGEITPKEIQLEDKRLDASLAHCQAKQLGRNEAGPTLWLRDPKEVWDTAYPISDLTRLV